MPNIITEQEVVPKGIVELRELYDVSSGYRQAVIGHILDLADHLSIKGINDLIHIAAEKIDDTTVAKQLIQIAGEWFTEEHSRLLL